MAMIPAAAVSTLPLRAVTDIHTVETLASAMAALRIIGNAGPVAPRAARRASR